jgi:phosphocarrier protein FPr
VLGDADLCARLAGTTDANEIHTALTAEPEEAGGGANGQVTGDVTRTVRIANPHGLHARPAAVIVEKALDYDAEVTIVAGDRRANAMSITQVIALGASVGDEVTVSATGDDAAAAVDSVLAVLLSTDDAS